jgi:hypothetical protein
MIPGSSTMRIRILAIPIVTFVSLCPGQDEGVNIEKLQVVDSRVADVSVLSTSLRINSTGLGEPAAFDQVYKGPGSSMFMRGNGALFAIFDQSVYVISEGYSIAQIPPSTVFHIGMPPPSRKTSGSQPPPPVVPDVVDLSKGVVRAGFGVVAPAGPATGNRISFASSKHEKTVLPRFVSDRAYRAMRLGEILSRRLDDQGGRPR